MIEIYNKDEVEKLSTEFIESISEKIKNQIVDEAYDTLKSYLYEHYDNNHQKIEGKLIDSISEEYIKNPSEYKFARLRKKMFEENKEEIIKTLSDESIEKQIEDVMMEHTRREYYFNWRWKEGIVKFILNNWGLFKDDDKINEQFGRELERRADRIKYLENKLEEINNII